MAGGVRRRSSSWGAGALERGATPADLMVDLIRWSAATAERRPPHWNSPNEVVFEAPVARLRDFSLGSRSRVVANARATAAGGP